MLSGELILRPVSSYCKPFRTNQTASDYYMVTRIDGPGGLAQKMNLVGNAMYADKYVNTGKSSYELKLILIIYGQDAFWGTTYVDTYGGNPDYNYITGLTTTFGGNVYNATDGSCADGTVCDASIALGGKFIKDLGLPFKWELSTYHLTFSHSSLMS